MIVAKANNEEKESGHSKRSFSVERKYRYAKQIQNMPMQLI